MTTLKTLKDHEFSTPDGILLSNIPLASPIVLRHEAINWIKYLINDARSQYSESHDSQCSMAQADILIQFFNIIPDDLK